MRLLQCTKRCPRRNEAFFTIFKDKLLIRVEQKDTKGNKSVSAKYIYVDENGTPILTKDLNKYDTSNSKYLKKKVLPEVKIEETKTRTFPEWFNDEIMLNKDNIRVKNYRKAETRNPNFSQNWDMFSNIYDFTNIATAGAINRFSPTQNIRLTLDAVRGNNIADSWMGNNGIVTDRFAKNHPYWSMAINGVGDAALWFSPKRLKISKPRLKPKKFSFKSKDNKEDNLYVSLNFPSKEFKEFKTYPLSKSLDIQWERWRNGGSKEKIKENISNLPNLSQDDKKLLDLLRKMQYTFKGNIKEFDRYYNFTLSKSEKDRLEELSNLGYINGFDNPTYNTVILDFSIPPNNAYADNVARGFGEGINKRFTNDIATQAHELSHMAYIPTEPIPKDVYNVNTPNFKYLFQVGNGTESSARLTQLKNYFGLTKDQPLTYEMFEYAKKNYVKDTGLDNNMTEWFNSIINIDKFLEWANKHSWIVATPLISKIIIDDNGKGN